MTWYPNDIRTTENGPNPFSVEYNPLLQMEHCKERFMFGSWV